MKQADVTTKTRLAGLRSRIGSVFTPRRLLFYGGPTLLVCVFFWQYLLTDDRLYGGDFDYYAQLYEAFRISVLKFQQLPYWNPWMSGGIPLLANPQFGPVSIQALLVLVIGTVYGLKLAYVLYAIAGFWGMYALCRQVFRAGEWRSLLVAGLWVTNGFFAGHSISHFTFASFFLLPWLFYILSRWRKPRTWLILAGFELLVLFSAIHYPFLVMNMAILLLAGSIFVGRLWARLPVWQDVKRFGLFLAKAGALTLAVGAPRLFTALDYTSNNPRPEALFYETAPGFVVMLQALFLPYGNLLQPPRLQWDWGEYAMYLGVGSTLALALILVMLCRRLSKQRPIPTLILWRPQKVSFAAGFIGVGLICLLLAIGDYGIWTPYHWLRELPGFSETRVSSRWLSLTMFSILVLFAVWKARQRAVNILLALAVIELFIWSGPPRVNGSTTVELPAANFPAAYRQYDNGMTHKDFGAAPQRSYYFSTRNNTGQIYSDDSIVNTLNKVIGTVKCGDNINPACDLVLSDNADIIHWSPNKIELRRTAPGDIVLNMNIERNWRINGQYPFRAQRLLDPTLPFVIPDRGETEYSLRYAPRLSPSWLHRRFTQ